MENGGHSPSVFIVFNSYVEISWCGIIQIDRIQNNLFHRLVFIRLLLGRSLFNNKFPKSITGITDWQSQFQCI